MADEVLGISAKFDINDIGRSIDALCNSLTGIGSSAEAASRIIQQAFSNVDAASTTTVQDIENVLNKLESLSAHKKKDLEIAQGTLEKLAQEQEKLQERMRSVEANTEAYSELERKLEGVGQQLVNQSAFVNALTQESDALANAVNTVTDALEQMRQKSAETPAPSIVAPEGGGESAPAVDTSAIVEGANAATEALDATTEAAKQTSEAVSSVTESSEALNTAAESATNVAQGVEAINEQASRTGEAVEQTGTSFAKRLYDAQMQVLHLKELWQEQKQTVAELQAQVDGMNGMVPERLKYELQEQKDLLAEYTTRLQQAQLDVERIKVEQQMFGDESNKTATALEAILMQLDKWQQAISNQEQLNARLQEQRDNFAAIQESVNALSESTDPLIEKYQQLKQEFENLNSYTGVIKSEGNEDELKQHYDDLTLTTRQYREAVVEASAAAKGAFQLQQQAVNALEGELKQLEDALAQALATKNTDAADALSQQIATMSGQLENAKEKLAELGEKAQQTESELNKMAQTTQQMTDSVNASWLDTLKEKLVAGKDAVVGWATGHGKAQEAISSFGNAVGKLPGPLGNVITSIKGMTKASWAFISTPIGIVLGAIALALQAVFKWFNKSSEGQMVFAKISGYVGSILESLTDILMKVGSYLFHAFADAQGPMHAFAQGLVTTLKYAVQAAAKLLNGLGDMLHGIGLMFQGEFSQGWDVLSAGFDKAMHGVEDAVRSAIEGVKTAFEGSIGMLKMGIDAAKAFSATDFEAGASKIHKNAVATANMKEQEKRLEIELGEATMKREQQQQEYNEKLSKMYHLQGAERKKAIEELKKMRKDMFQPQIDAQTQLLDLYTRQANMHTRSLESFKQERDMRTNILRLQAQQAGAARMLERMEASTDRKMESQAKSAAKRAAAEAKRDAKTKQKIEEAEAELGNVTIDNAEARTRQAVELQEKIDEATISAMEKGRKKVMKERE